MYVNFGGYQDIDDDFEYPFESTSYDDEMLQL